MMTYPATAADTLDESACAFVSNFMSNVARVAGDGNTSRATLARIETLLVDALAGEAGSSGHAWSTLYRTIGAVVASGRHADDARRAHAYLRAFMRENEDLAHEAAAAYVEFR